MSIEPADPTCEQSIRAMDRRQFLSAGAGMAAASLFSRGTGGVGVEVEPRWNDVLIVYLTRTGNTRAVAKIIREETGGNMVSIVLETPYPEDYEQMVSQVDRENERGYVPPLKTEVEGIGEYDAVFLGFPTWDMQLPPPMKSFLHDHDLHGHTVIPFNTHGGYGVGSSLRTVEELCQESDILEGFSTRGGLERDEIYLAIKGERRKEVHAEVADWLTRIQS